LWALKNGTEVKEITDGVYKVPNPGPFLAWGAIGVVCPGTPQHNIYCFERDISYSSAPNKTSSATTARGCQSNCERDSVCHYWSWTTSFTCYLRTVIGKRVKQPKGMFVSGPKRCTAPTTATPTPPPTGKCNDEEWTNYWGFRGTPPEGMRELSKDTGVTDKDVCKKKCKDIKKCQFYVLSFDNGYNVPGCKLYALKDGTNLNKIIEGVHSDMVMFMKEDVAGVVCQEPSGTEPPSTEPPATEPPAPKPKPPAEDCKEQELHGYDDDNSQYLVFKGDLDHPIHPKFDGMKKLYHNKSEIYEHKGKCKEECKRNTKCQFYWAHVGTYHSCTLYERTGNLKEIIDNVHGDDAYGDSLNFGVVCHEPPGTEAPSTEPPATEPPAPKPKPPAEDCKDIVAAKEKYWEGDYHAFAGNVQVNPPQPSGMRQLDHIKKTENPDNTNEINRAGCLAKCKGNLECQFYWSDGYGCTLYKRTGKLEDIVNAVYQMAEDDSQFTSYLSIGVVCRGPPGTEAPSTEPPAPKPPAAPTTAAATEAPTSKPAAEDCKEQEWTDYKGFKGTNKGTPEGMTKLGNKGDVKDTNGCKGECRGVPNCRFYILGPSPYYGCTLYALKDGADVNKIIAAVYKDTDSDTDANDDTWTFQPDSVAGVIC